MQSLESEAFAHIVASFNTWMLYEYSSYHLRANHQSRSPTHTGICECTIETRVRKWSPHIIPAILMAATKSNTYDCGNLTNRAINVTHVRNAEDTDVVAGAHTKQYEYKQLLPPPSRWSTLTPIAHAQHARGRTNP
jgi:hypothetical protein